MIDIITANPTFTTLTLSGLTIGRVPYVSTGGLIADDADFGWDVSTNALTLGTTIVTPVVATGENNLYLYPKGANEGRILFKVGKGVGSTTTYTGAQVRIEALTGPDTVQSNDHYNSVFCMAAKDSSNNMAKAFDLASEGSWTLAGGYTERRLYFWEYDHTGGGGRGIFFYQTQSEESDMGYNFFNFGDLEGGTIELRVFQGRTQLWGRPITTEGDGFIPGLEVNSTFLKNDSNTRAFTVSKIYPTFNFGASNTATTVTVLGIDTLNTSVTGLSTVNLITASYGGSLRYSLTSAGALEVVTENASAVTHTTYNNGTGGASYQDRKSRGTALAPRRALALDTLGSFNVFGAEAADSSTDATFSAGAAGSLKFYVDEGVAFTSTGHGTGLVVQLAAPGDTTLSSRLTITSSLTTVASGFTVSAGAITFTGGSSLLVPSSAAYAPTAAASFGYDSTQNAWSAGGAGTINGKLPRVLSVQFSTSDTLTASVISTAETDFATTFAVPANYFQANKTLRVTVITELTGSGSPPTAIFRLKLGSTTIVSTGTVSLPTSVTAGGGLQFLVQGTAAPGASVNVEGGMIVNVPSGVAGNTTAQGVAVATNAGLTLAISIQFSANTAANSVKVRQVLVEELN